jgi:hypothetical protein
MQVRPGSAAVPVAAVVALAEHVSAADPAACLFFTRADTGPAAPAIDLWLSAAPWVRADAPDVLRSRTADGGSLWAEDGVPRQVRHPHVSGRDVTDEMAAVSSVFALAVLTGGAPRHSTPFGRAVAQLRGITGLLPAATRRPFLFRCWQTWSAVLSPECRSELAAGTAACAGTLASEPPIAQQAYLEGTCDVLRRQRSGHALPTTYLWFLQASATHDRLAVPADTAAAAALAVRGELAGRANRVSALTPGRPA